MEITSIERQAVKKRSVDGKSALDII